MEKGELVLKLKMLWLYGWAHRKEWVADVWRHEWSERMCCDGYMCGCYGSDWGSWWEHLWQTRHHRKGGRSDA